GARGACRRRLLSGRRLGAGTEGLVGFDEGRDLAFRLTHPRYKVAKEYVAVVAGSPSQKDIEALRSGVDLDDGKTAPAEVEVVGFDGAPGAGRTEVRVVIREGRQRQVRRMLQAVGRRPQSLRRTGFGRFKRG